MQGLVQYQYGTVCAHPRGHGVAEPFTRLCRLSLRKTKLKSRHGVSGTEQRGAECLRHRSQLIQCKAETSGRGTASPASRSVEIPQSREQAIAQACEALTANLQEQGRKGKPAKGFKAGSSRRLAVEIAVADESPAAVVSLAEDVLNGLPPDFARGTTLVFGSIDAALLASTKLRNQVMALDDAPEEPVLGPLLVVGPTADQVAELGALLARWRGKEVMLLNPGWMDEKAVPASHAALVKSFETVFCFQPIAMQVFVVRTEGAVFRRATRAQPTTPPWQILKKGWGDSWRRIGQMSRRPGAQDLENAFAAASASESPITAGLKGLRQLVPGKKD